MTPPSNVARMGTAVIGAPAEVQTDGTQPEGAQPDGISTGWTMRCNGPSTRSPDWSTATQAVNRQSTRWRSDTD
ncbi:MAG: hypothetical protein QOK20_2999, partial [Acidimicrobiaceae bacterium]|nr:hypothetical protein [Acidimicrobiaceae bacterium]